MRTRIRRVAGVLCSLALLLSPVAYAQDAEASSWYFKTNQCTMLPGFEPKVCPPAASTVSWTPSASGEQVATGLGYGSSSYSFTSVAYAAGNPVVYVWAGGSSRVTTAVSVNAVSCTKQFEASNTEQSIWTCPAVAAGSYDVAVTANFGLNTVYISTGSMTGASSGTATSSANKDFAYQSSNPVQATSALTRPAGGLALYFANLGGGTEPITILDGGTSVDGSWLQQIVMSASGTPSFNVNSSGYAGILGATWAP